MPAKTPTAKRPRTAPAKRGAPTERRRAYLRADARRQQILDAAREVFARTSLHGSRTRDLAAAAAVNQATLFAHFASKEALFEAAVIGPVLEAMRGMHERAREYAAAGSRAEVMQLSRATIGRHVETMNEIFPLFVAAFFSDMDAGRRLYREKMLPLMKERAAVLAGSRLVKPGLDADFVELLTWGSFFAIAMDRAFTGGRWSLEEIVRQFSVISATGFAHKPARPPAKTAKSAAKTPARKPARRATKP